MATGLNVPFHKSGLLRNSTSRYGKLLASEMKHLGGSSNGSRNNYAISLIEFMIESLERDLQFANLKVRDFDEYLLMRSSYKRIEIKRTTDKEYRMIEDGSLSDRHNIKRITQIGKSYNIHLDDLISKEKQILQEQLGVRIHEVMFKLIISPIMQVSYDSHGDSNFKFTNIHYFIDDEGKIVCNENQP